MWFVRACLIALCAALLGAAPLGAQQKPIKAKRGKVVLVLDASGSMWGNVLAPKSSGHAQRSFLRVPL